MKIFTAFLFLLLPLLASAKEFYYYKNQKIFIHESNKILVELKESNKNFIENLISTSPFLQDFNQETVFSKTQDNRFKTLCILEFKEGSSETTKQDFVNFLKNQQEVYSVFSGYQNKNEGMFVFGEFLIQFKPFVSRNQVNNFLQNNNLTLVDDSEPLPNYFVVKIPQNTEANFFDLVNSVNASELVNFSEPNFILQDLLDSDPLFPTQWGMHNTGQFNGIVDADVDALEVWENVTTGDPNIVIAVFDTGIDATHPDLAGNVVTGFNTINNTTNPTYAPENEAHGTCTSGIAAAVGDNNEGIHGTASTCKIMQIKIFPFVVSQTVTGINWSWQNGADVMSNSWGGSSPVTSIESAFQQAKTQGREGKGCVILASSGNNDNPDPHYPSAYTSTISIGSTSMCEERKSPVSCDGENFWGASYGDQLNFVVPGVTIQTTDIVGVEGYSTGNYSPDFGGTSSACPLAAGIAALVVSVDTMLTSDEVQTILETTCEKVGNYTYNQQKTNGTWDFEMGYGRANAYEAVAKACKPKNFELIDPINASTYVIGTIMNFNWEKSAFANKLDTLRYEFQISPNTNFSTISFTETLTDTVFQWQALLSPQDYFWRVIAKSLKNGSQVVSTGANSITPYFTFQLIQPTGPYLIYNSFSVNDQNEDNDGLADFYETVNLNVLFENVGIQNTINTTATLTENSPYVTVVNGTANLPPVTFGTILNTPGIFTISINGNVPDKEKVKMTLSVTDGTNTWTSYFYVVLHSPVFVYDSFSLVETTGNGDTFLQPNETGNLTVLLKNIGSANAQNVNLVVTSLGFSLTIQNQNATIGTIGANPSVSASSLIPVTATQNANYGETVPIGIVLTIGNNFSQTLEGTAEIGNRSYLLDIFNDNSNEWQFTNTFTGLKWAIDSTASQIGTQTAYKSFPFSLNYNNGTNFISGTVANSGEAISPVLDISTHVNPVLRFWSLHDVEGNNSKDQRWVKISNDGFATILDSVQLSNLDPQQTWSQKSMNLNNAWGKIQIKLAFNSVDGGFNFGKGWFVDNLIVANSLPTPTINVSKTNLKQVLAQSTTKTKVVTLANTGQTSLTYSIVANSINFPQASSENEFADLLAKQEKYQNQLETEKDRTKSFEVRNRLIATQKQIQTLKNGAKISETLNVPWLNLNLTNGSILSGDFVFLNVQFVPGTMLEGFYYATITITSNDPNKPTTNIDVVMNVDNTPMEIGFIPSVLLYEDTSDQLALGDYVVEGNPSQIFWTAQISDPNIAVGIVPIWNFLNINPAPNYFTASQKELILTATHSLGGDFWTDTISVVILPVNDPPTAFNIVSPANFATINSPPQNKVTFTWQKSFDLETQEPYYSIEFAQTSNFANSTLTVVGPDSFVTVTFNSSGWNYWRVFVTDGTVTLPCANFYRAVNVILSGVEDENNLPKAYKLSQNYPNPFNPTTTIEFAILESGKTELEIFNVLGQKIRTLVSEKLLSGSYKVKWNGTDENGKQVSSGIYFYKLKSGNFSETKKMVLLK
ncbi:S8 family serine peptidase [bacterium]|nr:S8 family serine peptidase [bacterium]